MLVVLAAVVMSVAFYPRYSLNHDSSWYLLASGNWISGAHLYTDIMEISPPLIFYLTAPAIFLSELTHVSPTTSFFAYTSLLAGIAVLWSARILGQTSLPVRSQVALTLGVLVGLFVLPVHEFGQREHLMLILAMPYLLHLCTSGEQDASPTLWEKAALGLVAALGLGLKPYFLLIPFCIVVSNVVRTKRFTPIFDAANLAVALSLCVYAVTILVAYPEYLREIVPLVLQTYFNVRLSTEAVLSKVENPLTAILAILLLATGFWRDRVGTALAAATLGASASYFIQSKGWNYQIIPFSFFIGLTALWIAQTGFSTIWMRIAGGITAVFIAAMVLGQQISYGPYRSGTTAAFAPFTSGPNERILVLSSNFSAAFPFVNEVEGQWSSRFPAQQLLPGALVALSEADCSKQRSRCRREEEILDKVRSWTVDDIVHRRPALVFIDDRARKDYFGGLTFNYLDFLSADSRFGAEWSRYRLVGRVLQYQVWRRDVGSDRAPGPA